MIEKKIEEKKKEIEHYKGVLERYGRGRWYWKGVRHLEGLEKELEELYNEYGTVVRVVDAATITR